MLSRWDHRSFISPKTCLHSPRAGLAAAGARADAARILAAAKEGKPFDASNAGSAWSHNFLNQKPWHPLNFRNQARVFEAEQEKLATKKRDAMAKAEFQAEQEYMKTLSYLSPAEQIKYKERQSVSFMYQKPPGMDAAIDKPKDGAPEESKAVAKADGEAAVGDKRRRGEWEGIPQQLAAGHVANMLGAVSALQQQERFELKPQSGMMGRRSPPRGEVDPNAANQLILASESDEDEFGGAAGGDDIESKARRLLKAEKKAAKDARRAEKSRKLEQAEQFLRAQGIDPHAAALSSKPSKHKDKDKHKEKSKQKKSRKS